MENVREEIEKLVFGYLDLSERAQDPGELIDKITALITQKEPVAASPLQCGVMADAIALYEPPFSFKGGYIWDESNMVADQGDGDDREASLARIRGWGRISYMENPESLQDAVGEHIAIALTEYWQKKRP